MGGSLVRGSRDAGLQDEDSHADEEEDWGRIKYDGGGGSFVEEVLGPRVVEMFRPIARVFSRLRSKRRDVHWQSPRQEQLTSSIPNLATAFAEVISNIGSTFLSEPTVSPSAGITSQLQLPEPTTVQITVNIPTLVPTPAPITTDSTAQLTLDTRITTTIVSTISNFAPNGTGGDLTRAPITSGGTVIIFTTPTVRNRTTLMNTLSTSTTTRKMNKISTAQTTTSNLTTISTVYADYRPQPTEGEHTPPSPTNSGVSDDLANNSSSNSSSPPVEPRLVGGIVGGVAGLALIVFALFMLLKRHRRQRQIQALDDAGYGGPPAGGPSMVQRSISFLGGGFAGRSHGGAPSSDPPDVEPAERGFVKVSGRKLPPAIGGPRPDIPRPDIGSMRSNAQSSYYTVDDSGVGASMSTRGPSRYSTSTVQASNPFASPPSSPTGPGPGPGPGPGLGSCQVQGHADIDSIEEMRAPPKPPPPRPLFNRQLSLGTDGVGRSHPSHDGSRGSRFTEDIT